MNIICVSNEGYHKQKNEKNETIEDVVCVLTKDVNLTNHFMPYLICTNLLCIYTHDVVHVMF